MERDNALCERCWAIMCMDIAQSYPIAQFNPFIQDGLRSKDIPRKETSSKQEDRFNQLKRLMEQPGLVTKKGLKFCNLMMAFKQMQIFNDFACKVIEGSFQDCDDTSKMLDCLHKIKLAMNNLISLCFVEGTLQEKVQGEVADV